MGLGVGGAGFRFPPEEKPRAIAGGAGGLAFESVTWALGEFPFFQSRQARELWDTSVKGVCDVRAGKTCEPRVTGQFHHRASGMVARGWLRRSRGFREAGDTTCGWLLYSAL